MQYHFGTTLTRCKNSQNLIEEFIVKIDFSLSTHYTPQKLKTPLGGERGARPLNLLPKSTPAHPYAKWTPNNHWVILISLPKPNLFLILAIRHKKSTKMLIISTFHIPNFKHTR